MASVEGRALRNAWDDVGAGPEDSFESIQVDLEKGGNSSFGFSIGVNELSREVLITRVTSEPAKGRLQKDDIIQSIDNITCKGLAHEQVVGLIKGKSFVVLIVLRKAISPMDHNDFSQPPALSPLSKKSSSNSISVSKSPQSASKAPSSSKIGLGRTNSASSGSTPKRPTSAVPITPKLSTNAQEPIDSSDLITPVRPKPTENTRSSITPEPYGASAPSSSRSRSSSRVSDVKKSTRRVLPETPQKV
jgi:hypothetical protein